jgi:transposase
MPQVAIIGVDLAKRVFQLHGAAADGSVLFRKKLTRERFLSFLVAGPAFERPLGRAGPPLIGGGPSLK